jgi:soluble lytic murein transglycosylase-like protein
VEELGPKELEKLFCLYGKKYAIKKLLLKAVAEVESGFNQTAYRYEPGFWKKYLEGKPEWKDRDPSEVSASYGLFQLMYTTATMLGFSGKGEDLYNPVINIELGAKLLRVLIDKVRKRQAWGTSRLWDIEIALACYNGGTVGNPDEKGNLRNQRYVDRVLEAYGRLKKIEKECDDEG